MIRKSDCSNNNKKKSRNRSYEVIYNKVLCDRDAERNKVQYLEWEKEKKQKKMK